MTALQSSVDALLCAARAADERFGYQMMAFDVSQHLAITDAFLVVTADSERQVSAIVENVEAALLESFGARPTRREGDRENRWVLLDYVDYVIHIQLAEERELYSLERLWKDCPPIDLGAVNNLPGRAAVNHEASESEIW